MPTPLADPSNVAVVCVECQNGVLGPDAVLPALATDSADLVGNIRRLLDSAREFGARVVHATYEGDLGGRPTGTARLWRALGAATAEWKPGSSATSVVPDLLAPLTWCCHGTTGCSQRRLRTTAGAEGLRCDDHRSYRSLVEPGDHPHRRRRHTGRVSSRCAARRRRRYARQLCTAGAGQHHCRPRSAHYRRRVDPRMVGIRRDQTLT